MYYNSGSTTRQQYVLQQRQFSMRRSNTEVLAFVRVLASEVLHHFTPSQQITASLLHHFTTLSSRIRTSI